MSELMEKIDELSAAGRIAYKGGHWERCVDTWTKVSSLANDIEDPELKIWNLKWSCYHAGAAFYALARFEDARNCFEQALEYGLRESWLFQLACRTYGALGQYDLCLSMAEQAVQLDASDRFAADIRRAARFMIGSETKKLPEKFDDTLIHIGWDTPVYDVSEHTGLFSSVLDLSCFGVVAGGDWDRTGMLFDDFEVSIAIRQCLVETSVSWQDTDFYINNARRIGLGEELWNCKTISDLDLRLAGDLASLFASVAKDGMCVQLDLHGWNPLDDIRVGIGRDGQILFMNGQHRLAIARAMKLPRIPVRVVLRHSEWQGFVREVEDFVAAEPTRAVYQELAHPDLARIPFHHSIERLRNIKDLVRDDLVKCCRILDIGANWGAISNEFSDLGPPITAVEYNPQFYRFLEFLCKANGGRYSTWFGSVFEFPDIERYDGWIALNIFHHFLRTEAAYEAFVAMMKRARVKRILFQSHDRARLDPMPGAFVNFYPDEFAYFIAENTGLSNVRHVWTQDDGRRVYVID